MPAPLTTTFLALGAILVLAGSPWGVGIAIAAALFEVGLFLLSGTDRGMG